MAECYEVQLGWVPNEVRNKCEEDGIHLNTCQLAWSTACLYDFTTAGMDYDYIDTYCTRMDLVRRVIHHAISSFTDNGFANLETHRHQEPKVEKNLRLGWLRCFKNLDGIIPRSPNLRKKKAWFFRVSGSFVFIFEGKQWFFQLLSLSLVSCYLLSYTAWMNMQPLNCRYEKVYTYNSIAVGFDGISTQWV